MGKYKAMDDRRYADMYGMQMKDEYDDEGNLNDNEHANKAMVRGHQANNYDMRRAHEMLQDDGFRRHMKQEGFKGVDRMVKDNMPHSGMINALADYGKQIGTHNGKGDFDTRDLGATFKAFSKENSSHHNDRMETMMDDRMSSLKKSLQDSARDTKPADEAVNYEMSDELSSAQKRLDDGTYDYDINAKVTKPGKSNESAYQQGAVTESPTQSFEQSNQNPSTANVAGQATGSYLEEFKNDVRKAGKIGYSSESNLSNALNKIQGDIN